VANEILLHRIIQFSVVFLSMCAVWGQLFSGKQPFRIPGNADYISPSTAKVCCKSHYIFHQILSLKVGWKKEKFV